MRNSSDTLNDPTEKENTENTDKFKFSFKTSYYIETTLHIDKFTCVFVASKKNNGRFDDIFKISQ